ncbi:MAG: MFS transporter [Chloroflexi bacterium]|nr:MFS transporter [Chloroflexota bacterium]
MWLDRIRRSARLLAQVWRSGDRNTLIFALEPALAAAAGLGSAFNSAYLLRLGAPNTLMGLLASLPSLAVMLLYIPAGLFMQRRRTIPWVVGGQALYRGLYLLIAAAPLFAGAAVTQVTAGLMMLASVAPILSSVALTPLMSDVIPPQQRASVIAWRTTLRNGTAAGLVYLAGLWLDGFGRFPLNHQWLYLFSALLGVLHTLLLALIKPPARADTAPQRVAAAPERRRVDLSLFRRFPAFTRLMLNKLILDAGDTLVGPLMGIYFVRLLGATNTWLGASSTLTSIGVVTGLWAWRRAVRRLGEGKVLLYSLPFAACFTLLAALLPDLRWILGLQVLTVVLGAGANMALEILYLETLPAGFKSAATGLYQTVFGVAAVLLPMAGVTLADRIGVVPAIAVGGALRLAGAAVFYLWPVRPLASEPAVPSPRQVRRGSPNRLYCRHAPERRPHGRTEHRP